MERRAIDMDVWAKNSGPRIDPAELRGRKCWGGLDLSSRTGITAWVKLFEPDEPGGRLMVVPRFWMPFDALEDRAEYRQWFERGFIEVTPGNVLDRDVIERAVLEDSAEFDIESAAYDPWNAIQLAAGLRGKGVPMVEFFLGLRRYCEHSKNLFNLLTDTRLDHGDNPVLHKMAGNLTSTWRIVGMTALIMAIGRRAETQGIFVI